MRRWFQVADFVSVRVIVYQQFVLSGPKHEENYLWEISLALTLAC